MNDTGQDSTSRTELKDKGPRWWKLPFDPTTNFSLFGYLLGGCRWNDPRKRTDFTLKDE